MTIATKSTLHLRRGALFCAAIFILFSTGKTPLHADDDAVPEAAEVVVPDADTPDVTAPLPARTGAHEPSAQERNLSTSASTIVLAANGKALVPIVIAARASAETRKTAGELASYLARISGAEFKVITPDGQAAALEAVRPKTVAQREAATAAEAARIAAAPEALPASGIVLGSLEEFVVPELRQPLTIHNGFDGREAYAIRTSPKRLLLIGATEKAVHHAAFRLLDTLGCRWFATGEHWEVIPSIPNLQWNTDITDRPTIATRVIAFMDGAMSDENFNGNVYSERGAMANWTRRNGLGASFGTSAAHSWHRIFQEYNEEFLAHPEYFAEVDGKRVQPTTTTKDGKKIINGVFGKLELGNPVVRKMVLDYSVNYFKRNPDSDMMSFSPTDGGGFSQSPESQKLGSVSDAVYGMANEIARTLQKEFPGQGKMVGVYAYRETAAPPTFALEPNVYVELATLFNMSQYTYAELFDMWPKKARNLGFYEYFSFFDADYSHLPGSRAGSINFMKRQIPFYAGINAAAVFAQSSNAFGPHGRGYYLATKLLWNPKADADAVLEDFYQKAYGPAAPAMKRYHERVGRDADALFTDNLMGAAFRDVDEATRLAKDSPDVLARLRDVKQYLRYEELWRKVGAAPTRTAEDKAKYRELVVAAFRHAAAMRHTYMVQWNMVADRMGRGPAATLKDVSLIIKAKRKTPKFSAIPGDPDVPNVWDGATPETPEEIEANFQEGLKSFPTTDIEERKFNLNDLVAVTFPASTGMMPAAVSKEDQTRRADYYQSRSARYVFYSVSGEPVEFQLLAGRRFSNGNASWTLSKPDGTGGTKVVEQGSFPADKAEHAISVKVPAKGAYYLDVDFRNQGGTIGYRVDKPASVTWGKTGSAVKGFSGPVFYVPKGTRQIQYFFRSNNGGPQTIMQPDGKEALRLMGGGSGEVATIPVPAGMDGKVWRISPRNGFRSQWFFNIPNIAAATPDALLVPREIAVKDGLPLR